MRKDNTTITKIILGALACLVLFFILLCLKTAPNAPFPNMPWFILIAPFWTPILTIILVVGGLFFINALERQKDLDDRKPYE